MNDTQLKIAIGFESNELYAEAKSLADKYDFVLDDQQLPRLSVTPDKLVLLSDKFSPQCVDFNPQVWQKRHDAGKKQGLVRACKPTNGLRILDVTAGWGRDAAVLASFGAEVLMLERQPVMVALLDDALQRLKSSFNENSSNINHTMSLALLYTDAKDYLQTLLPADYPDVIYIDPMHPARQKSALVKKDMQILQNLFGADEDAKELIELAVGCARKRVVVKWPQRLPTLVQPTMSIDGKTVRFDIYIT